MTNPSAMNSRNKAIPRKPRPAAGAASSPAGAADRASPGSVFLAKSGRARYQGRAFSAPFAECAAWSAAIAQLVEHVIRNDGVTGSNPVCGTNDLALAQFPIAEKCPGVTLGVTASRL